MATGFAARAGGAYFALGLAEGEGFEPPVDLRPRRFSRPLQSTTLPSLPEPTVGTRLARSPLPRLKCQTDQLVSLTRVLVFKTGALNHSATLPSLELSWLF